LNTMTASFGANDHVVLVRANFSPDGEDRLLREATKVDKLAVLVDLGKGSTISLSDCDKFSTIGRGPTPR
jgi:hypothetical protein